MTNDAQVTAEILIDLARPPAERWRPLQPYAGTAQRLLAQYTADLRGIAQAVDFVAAYRAACIPADYGAELDAIAALIGATAETTLLVNLYYDVLKVVLGCTAFAVDTPAGPLHARNLDWWTQNGLLARATLITRFHHAPAGPFQVVSWPGFIGALTGVAPGRFAISLNAVLSDEPPAFASPITLLLRAVLEAARSFEEAVTRLAAEPIACDCLLLVTGTAPGEMVVIERTPTRAALRHAQEGRLVVANEYRALASARPPQGPEQELQRTSDGRFERAAHLLQHHVPQSSAECWAVLTDPQVQMGITVQQVVMSAAQGLLEVRLPAGLATQRQ